MAITKRVKIDPAQQAIISEKALAVITDYVTNVNPDFYSKRSANGLKTSKDEFRDIPELREYMDKIGLLPYWRVTLVISLVEDLPVHMDHPPRSYSILIPILNTKGSSTVFYKPKDSSMDLEHATWLNKDDFIEIERSDSDFPYLLDTRIPHGAELSDSTPKPRLMLAIRLGLNFTDKEFNEFKYAVAD